MSSAWIPAVSALAGAAIGGVGTYLSSSRLESRRFDREDEREDRTTALNARRAARMIEEELQAFWLLTDVARKTGLWWEDNMDPKTDQRLDEFGADLAMAATVEQWRAVQAGYSHFHWLQHLRVRAQSRQIEDSHKPMVIAATDRLKHANDLLEPMVSSEP